MNVLIINQCAHNKGDRAVLLFILRELDRNGASSITVSTSEPKFWENEIYGLRPSIQFVPWGWYVEYNSSKIKKKLTQIFYRRFFYPIVRYAINTSNCAEFSSLFCNKKFRRSLKNADLVISTGGHHVTTLLAPDAVSPQIYDMALTLLHKKRLVLWSQSIGPLDFADTRNRALVSKILTNATGLYVRDTQTFDVLRNVIKEHKSVKKTYESVIGIHGNIPFTPVDERHPYVGISVYGAQQRSSNSHSNYVKCLAKLADRAIERGFVVRFFPMELKGSQADDRPLILEIIKSARNGSKCQIQDKDLETLDHLAEVSKCQLFIGHKTHSVIFALITGTPLVAIAYHKKTVDFMKEYNLNQQCIEEGQLKVKNLLALFDRTCTDQQSLSKIQSDVSKKFAEILREDFRIMMKTSISASISQVY
jgi:polysaccharide pyruvyl transferase WcaK-like protein